MEQREGSRKASQGPEKQPALSYKSHFVSVLSRSLFFNASLTYVNSAFVASIGARNYSGLYLISTVFIGLFYVLSIAFSERLAYRIYFALILLCGIFFGTFFFDQNNHHLLYLFSIVIMVSDMVGMGVVASALQANTSPGVFRAVYQRFVGLELLGRMTALCFLAALGFLNQMNIYFYVSWVFLVIHGVFFVRVLRKLETAAFLNTQKEDVFRRTHAVMKFFSSNELVRNAIVVMIIASVSKFLVEFLFYQSVEQKFLDVAAVTKYVSSVMILVMILTLSFQYFFGQKLLNSLSLSVLLSISPILVLAFSATALVLPPFYPTVGLMLVFQCVNRSVQLPVTRQCLVPVPLQLRFPISSLTNLLMCIAGIAISGGMVILKSYLQLSDFILILIGVSVLMFFFSTQLDSYYIKNLWGYFKQSKAGQWDDRVWDGHFISLDQVNRPLLLEKDSPAEERTRGETQERLSQVIRIIRDKRAHASARKSVMDYIQHPQTSAKRKALAILNVYLFSYDQPTLQGATIAHQALLKSDSADNVILGLDLLAQSGLSSADTWVNALVEHHPDDRIVKRARQIREIEGLMNELNPYKLSALSRRKLRVIIDGILNGSGERELYLNKISALTRMKSKRFMAAFIDVLHQPLFFELRETLYQCIDEKNGKIHLKPLIVTMFDLTYREAAEIRNVLESLGIQDRYGEISHEIESRLKKAREANFKMGVRERKTSLHRHAVMHALFLEELKNAPTLKSKYIRDTIQDLFKSEGEEKGILLELHMSFLKTTSNGDLWRKVLA